MIDFNKNIKQNIEIYEKYIKPSYDGEKSEIELNEEELNLLQELSKELEVKIDLLLEYLLYEYMINMKKSKNEITIFELLDELKNGNLPNKKLII